MDAHTEKLSLLLPKTGQVTSYTDGDDGYLEAGWWKGRLNVNNKTRFISKTIGGDDIVLDRATGLLWAADGDGAGCNSGDKLAWALAIAFGIALDFAGFIDWRLPNIFELASILDYSKTNPAIDEAFFSNTVSAYYWSSNTNIVDTDKAWNISFTSSIFFPNAKTDTYNLRCVRGGL